MPMTKRYLMMLALLGALSAHAADVPVTSESPAEAPAVASEAPVAEEKDTIYYAAERDFGDALRKIETRALFSYSNSNPYLNVFGGQLEVYYRASQFFAFGVEGAMYKSTKRDSAIQLEHDLKRHGYTLDTLSRSHAVRGIVRVTPLSSLSNLFSSSVMRTEIALSGRGGTVRYAGHGWGPSLGLGLELAVRFRGNFGFLAGASWDYQKAPNHPWESQLGFLVGPTFSF